LGWNFKTESNILVPPQIALHPQLATRPRADKGVDLGKTESEAVVTSWFAQL